MSSDESVVMPVRRAKRREAPNSDENESEFLPNLAGAAAAASSCEVTAVPRRSSRVRNRPDHYTIRASSPTTPALEEDEEETPNRLEQIDCISARDLGLPETHPASRLRIVVHPIAMALISFHAHLSRIEVIGYLGGAVRHSADGVDVLIAEAFPAQGLNERALASTGRNAFAEVEIDPESSVEVMNRLQQKKLQVVGWYHSHPDAGFTVQPSRVDIENQSNYQQFIFKDLPFVAAIIAPYNENLPDHNPDVQFFSVHEEETPLKLPFTVGIPDGDGLDGYAFANAERFPLDAFIAESLTLVSSLWDFAKRVRLDRDWREGVLGLDKLRRTLQSILNEMTTDCEQVRNNRQNYLESVKYVMDEVDQRWTESGKKDDEKRARNRQANKKKKRTRR